MVTREVNELNHHWQVVRVMSFIMNLGQARERVNNQERVSLSSVTVSDQIGRVTGIKDIIKDLAFIEFTDYETTKRLQYDDLINHSFSVDDKYFYIDDTKFIRQRLDMSLIVQAKISVN